MRLKSKSLIVLFLLAFTFSCSKESEPTISNPPIELPASIQLNSIPEGTFAMGGTTNMGDAPTVSVSISAFQISEKEITNQQ